MELNKSKIKILKAIVNDKKTRKDIAEATKLSINRCSEILIELEKGGFIARKRFKKKLIIKISNLSYAQKFKELAIARSAFSFEEFLVGVKFRILGCCLLGWKTTKDIAEQLSIAFKTVQNNMGLLQDRGLLIAEKSLYRFDKKTWPKVYDFLYCCRYFSPMIADILWKFEDETIFEVSTEEQIRGVLTGFSVYYKHGVKVHTIKYCCYLPKKKLSKEDIFIHSLYQIGDDPRFLDLAIVFYIKNKPEIKKLTKLATRYDLYPLLQDFISIIQTFKNTTVERIIPKILPEDSRREIEETLKLYKAKW